MKLIPALDARYGRCLTLCNRERRPRPLPLFGRSKQAIAHGVFCYLLPARIWHWTNASFVTPLFPPRFENQLRPSAEIPPPFCTAHRQPSLSCILLHGELSSCATFGPAGFGCGAGSETLRFRSVDEGASVDIEAFGNNCQIGVNLMAELFDFFSGLVSCIVIALAPLSLTSTGYFPELNRSTLSETFPAKFT